MIVSARAIQRLRAQFRWPQEEYNKIVSGPCGLYAAEEPERIENAGPAPAPLGIEQERPARSFQIRMADWLEHGSSPGCQKCNTARDLGWSFAGGPHSKTCVERYRDIFSGSEAGRLRLERAAKRLGARDPAVEAQRSAAAQEESRPLLLRQPEVIRSEAAAGAPVAPEGAGAGNDFEDEGMRDMEPSDVEDEDQDMGIQELQCEKASIAKIVNHMGGDVRLHSAILDGFCRSRNQVHVPVIAGAPHVFTEVSSPPRITACAKLLPGFGIVPGLALDLTTVDENGVAWDFDIPSRREEARRRIKEQKPMFLVGSPMCTAFCNWQRLNAIRRDPTVVAREWNKAMVHLEFVCRLYREQLEGGRFFRLHLGVEQRLLLHVATSVQQ